MISNPLLYLYLRLDQKEVIMDSVSKDLVDEIFGKILKDYRLRNNLTQEQIAEKVGISEKYISRIENGVSGVKTQTLIKYMNILGITPNVMYKEFINNERIKTEIELSEKIKDLPQEKIDFVFRLIDLLKNTL